MEWLISIVTYFFVEDVCAFERGHDHLAENALLLLEVSELLLEVAVLLFLVDHPQF
jgi:hypothetical protein